LAFHQVTCTRTAQSFDGSHTHITHLGLGTTTGYYNLITVEQAIAQLRSAYGDRYYTMSPSTGLEALVIEGGCEHCGQRPYVRTTADSAQDNNLKNLPYCAI